eukprot:TRINITY_DN23123_c0_g1_i1.p1 TRINITY_DN23123_c0_g1~~TRINITY_DN23123_c0_g1_i1.p1  ORF type:complete len:434 (-),score=177.45 TRINITY_DN23123_c0_g1_i1:44-1282(-)
MSTYARFISNNTRGGGLADRAAAKSHANVASRGALQEISNIQSNAGGGKAGKPTKEAVNGRPLRTRGAKRAAAEAKERAEREKREREERARQEQEQAEIAAASEAASGLRDAMDATEVDPMMLEESEAHNLSLEDIDEYDREDPQFCTEYVEEIFELIRAKETANRVDEDYMSTQQDLIPSYRTKIVKWMAEVNNKFRLLSETFFLAVNILDRFLMKRAVSRSRLQLLGATAMLVACKFEEIYLPQIDDFVYLCAEAYTRKDFLRMEGIILFTLDFNLAVPTQLHFLRRFSKAAFSDRRVHTLSKYITELSLSSYELLRFLPSEIAAAAVLIARNMAGIAPLWNSTLRHYTQYTEEDVMPCALMLNDVIRAVQEDLVDTGRRGQRGFSHPIARKYTSSRLCSVANIPYVALQ